MAQLVGHHPKSSPVWFLVRAHAWVEGSLPSRGVYERQPIDVCLSHQCFSPSHSHSFPLSRHINKGDLQKNKMSICLLLRKIGILLSLRCFRRARSSRELTPIHSVFLCTNRKQNSCCVSVKGTQIKPSGWEWAELFYYLSSSRVVQHLTSILWTLHCWKSMGLDWPSCSSPLF